jgi:hypothetical protein
MLEDLFKNQQTILIIVLIIIVIFLFKNDVKKENLTIGGLSTISIKSPHDNKYCAIHPGGKVICDANGVGPWEKITIENTPTGNKTLKSVHGKYCAVEDNKIMNCNRDVIGPWEQYNIENNADDTIAIKSLKTNQYCSIQPNGDVICDRDAKGPWENLDYRMNSIPNGTEYINCGVDGSVCNYSTGDVYYGVPDNYDIVSESRVQKSAAGKFTCLPTGFHPNDVHPVLQINDPVPGVQKSCHVKSQIGYIPAGDDVKQFTANSQQECHNECVNNANCGAWTMDTASKGCWLKSTTKPYAVYGGSPWASMKVR